MSWLAAIVLGLELWGPARASRVATPIGEAELAAVLRDGHAAVFGRPPSDTRLAMAWGQVALENGRGELAWNHNLGMVGGEPHFLLHGFRFRSFPDFVDGARGYWRAVCGSALRFFDAGDPIGAARQLARCGYHRTDPEHYGRQLRSLYWRGRDVLEVL